MTNAEFLGMEPAFRYEAKFELELDDGSEEFHTIFVPFSDFNAMHWGYVLVNQPPMDLEKIGAFGLQTTGGVFDEFSQRGVGSLELDFIGFQ